MVLSEIMPVSPGNYPLRLMDVPDPTPSAGQILIKVWVCGVCHTELDEIEGRLAPPVLPLILGHQVVGSVVDLGENSSLHQLNDRVGVGWIDSACGDCCYCRTDRENLCAQYRATGFDNNGGYAQLMTVDERFAFALPASMTDTRAAPLLCAGAIGFRSLRLTALNNGERLGLTGFGGSAHMVLQMAKHLFPDSPVYVFARNPEEREFALQLGAVWAGDTKEKSPQSLHAIIDTTPAWLPVVEAMDRLVPGGRLVINAIRKETSDQSILLQLNYAQHLWREKEIKSVANVTRFDVQEFLKLAVQMNINPEVECYPLVEANRALIDLKTKQVCGSKVLLVEH